MAPSVWILLRLARKAGVTVAGTGLLGVGTVMLVAPGPGLLLIVAGLALLGTEWVWAERASRKVRERAARAASRAASAVRRPKPEAGQGRPPPAS